MNGYGRRGPLYQIPSGEGDSREIEVAHLGSLPLFLFISAWFIDQVKSNSIWFMPRLRCRFYVASSWECVHSWMNLKLYAFFEHVGHGLSKVMIDCNLSCCCWRKPTEMGSFRCSLLHWCRRKCSVEADCDPEGAVRLCVCIGCAAWLLNSSLQELCYANSLSSRRGRFFTTVIYKGLLVRFCAIYNYISHITTILIEALLDPFTLTKNLNYGWKFYDNLLLI